MQISSGFCKAATLYHALLKSEDNGSVTLTECFVRSTSLYHTLAHVGQTEGEEVTFRDM